MCHIPRSLRTQTWKIVNRTIRGSLVSASLLLWKQDATAKSTSTTVGFKSPESVFSASRPLYIPPLLPQSALLNSLPGPLDAELVGQIQAYVESFQQLLHPTPRQARQIAQNSSVLWYNLRINAQRAAGMLFYNQQQFNLPEGDEIDQKELNIDYLQHNKTIKMLKESLVELVIAAQRSQADRCLGLMQTGLCHLHDVAVNLVTANSLTASPARVKVVLRFRLLGDFRDREPAVEDYDLSLPDSVTANDTGPERSVTLLVDCLNYPVTSAAFLDLCRRGFYEGLPVAFLPVEVGGSNRTFSATALGYFAEGDVSAVTGLQQRTPLEVLREEAVSEREAEGKSRYRTRRRFTAQGGARNSAVFTRARPVLDFSTVEHHTTLCSLQLRSLVQSYRAPNSLHPPSNPAPSTEQSVCSTRRTTSTAPPPPCSGCPTTTRSGERCQAIPAQPICTS